MAAPFQNDLSSIFLAEREGLIRIAARITDSRADAEDIVQQVWLRLERVGEGTAIENGRAYLARLTRNLAIDQLRGRERRAALQGEIERLVTEADDAPGQERIVDSLVILSRVRAAADGLGEPTRTIFGLNRFGGLSHKAIATKLGISTTTVENHIRKALAVLAAARDGNPGAGGDLG